MLIAIDYDDTYTLHPRFWDSVIIMALSHGHRVICVTSRYEKDKAEVIGNLGHKVEKVLFTGRLAKDKYAKSQGYIPDVWIDDDPFLILYKGGDKNA